MRVLFVALLLAIAVVVVVTRRAKTKRLRAAAVKAAKLRELRKPLVPFVSASLRGHAAQEPPKH
jgi:hypothetical protein